jgi:alkylation response protein AidB-like acyl-CoA dehydrogenase
MNQLHSEREQRFIELAAGMASEFATRAALYDEDAAFPYENYARLRDSGYSIMTIPEELGGLGATILQRIKAQERLAEGCGATSLAINMHFNAVGLLVDIWRKFKDPRVEAKLRQIASGRLICGGSASEPDNAVPVLRPRATARRIDGGWAVSGRKIFGTQSIALDLYFSEATWADAPQGESIITFVVPPKDTPGWCSRMTGTRWGCGPPPRAALK